MFVTAISAGLARQRNRDFEVAREKHLGGHDPNDRITRPVEGERLADHVRPATKAALPERATDDCHVIVSGAVLPVDKAAAQCRRDPKRGHEIRRHRPDMNELGFTAPGEIHGAPGDGGESLPALAAHAPVAVIGIGDGEPRDVARKVRLINDRQPFRLRQGHRTQHECVDRAEHRRCCADAQGDNHNRDDRETGRPGE